MKNTPYILQHQSHVWVGGNRILSNFLIMQLQLVLCSGCNHCKACSTCIQLDNLQHPSIAVIEPDGSYNLEQIDEVLERTRFTLNTNEKRFFIFTNAQELSSACSNRLLKTIEEPHSGYFFIFMASRTDKILPTILSRCFVKEFSQQSHDHNYSEIIEPITQSYFQNPIGFMKSIDKLSIKEHQTSEIVDLLIQHFHHKLTALHQKNNNLTQADEKTTKEMLKTTDSIILLKNALTQLPAQSGSKLFWKNLYLNFHAQSE